MFRLPSFAALLTFLASGASAFAAGADHGVSTAAEPLFRIGGLPVTNSMVTSWVIAFGLIVIVRLAVGRPKLVPSSGQAVVENLVQGVLDLTAPIVGSQVARKTFPLLVGLFTYILIQNWSGLLPGVGTIKHWDAASGHWQDVVRPGNADMNGTIALALVAFVAKLRAIDLRKSPSISETIDWARTLVLLGKSALDRALVEETLGLLLKYEEDREKIASMLPKLLPTT